MPSVAFPSGIFPFYPSTTTSPQPEPAQSHPLSSIQEDEQEEVEPQLVQQQLKE